MTHVCSVILIRRSFDIYHEQHKISLHNESIVLLGNDSNLLIVFYVQIMPDDFVMQLHR
ncbi:hypothetical protein OSK19_17060, partial [Escherichia coli]|nr:hypothetical protein [Escherichia coli]